MAIQSNKRLLLELDKHRRDINKKAINANVDDLNLDKLKPIVNMVALVCRYRSAIAAVQ